MLHLLDESLEAFLRAEVPLPPQQVDVSFEAPDSEWGAGVTKPTINLFLWDVRSNLEVRQAGMELVEDEDRRRHRRPPKPRVDCRYLVTAWTTEVVDEHRLLGSVLTTLLARQEIDSRYLRGGYASVRPLPAISVAVPDGKDNSDFWSALGGQLKPGLDLVVTATVDLALGAEAGPPVERYELAVEDKTTPDRISRVLSVGGEVEDESAIGALVRSPHGHAIVDAEGRFLVRVEEGDELVLEAKKEQRKKIPTKGRVRMSKGSDKSVQG